METNVNILTIKCPVCSRKFHKDNLSGHLKYEYQINKSVENIQNKTEELPKENNLPDRNMTTPIVQIQLEEDTPEIKQNKYSISK